MNTALVIVVVVLAVAVLALLVVLVRQKGRLSAAPPPNPLDVDDSAGIGADPNSAAPQLSMTEMQTAMQTGMQTAMEAQLAQSLQQAQELMAEKFENLATKVLDDKAKNFTEANAASITKLLDPVKTQVKEFRDKVEQIHTEDTKQQTELRTVIDLLHNQNTQLSQDADNLSKALKSEHHTQGNWGEMQLEQALQASGLQRDREYKLQPSFKNEAGETRRPDAVVMLPDSKSLVIDSKVSLAAYTRFVSATDETEKSQELESHAQAMQERVQELSQRGYEELSGLGSPEAVFMFTPIESALHATLLENPAFLTDALQKRVFVVTPSTITPALTIVAQLWRLADQERNTQEIIRQANGIYDKAVGLVESMEKIGRNLDSAQKSYNEAMTRLVEGNGNLVKRANDMTRLGITPKKDFPDDISSKAELETEHGLPQLDSSKTDPL